MGEVARISPVCLPRAGSVRYVLAASALGAVLGTARAFRRAKRDDRLAWLGFLAGSIAWLLGQLARDAAEVANATFLSHPWVDVGFLAAAPLWTIGLVMLLRRHGQ